MRGSWRRRGAYAREVLRKPDTPTADSVWAAAEAASPVEAVEAVTRELGLALGAAKISFLIADLSGRALVRLAHVQLGPGDGVADAATLAPDERRTDEESATVLPFDGGPAEQAIRTQQVPLAVLAERPDVARRLGAAIAAWSPALRRYKGTHGALAAERWLRSR